VIIPSGALFVSVSPIVFTEWVIPTAIVIVVILVRIALKQREKIEALKLELDLTTQRRKLVIDFLHDLGEAVAGGFKIEQLLQKIAQFSVNTTQATAGAVYLFDEERKNLRAEIVVGPFPPPIQPENFNEARYAGKPDQLERIVKLSPVPVDNGVIGEVARTGKPILIRNGRMDRRLPAYTDPSLQIRTAIYVPMKFSEQVVGVMVVVNKDTEVEWQSFNSGDLFLLDSLATHGAISFRNFALYHQQEQQKLVEADMRVASEVQRMLLPDHAPDVKNFDLFALNHAAEHVSGDYYDFIQLDDSHIGIVIADVSGKAVSGALVMATCRAILRTQCSSSHSPVSVVANVQRRLIADLPEDMFVTMIYGILDGERRSFKFARAGHDPVLWYQAANQSVTPIIPKGVAIGLGRGNQFEAGLGEREIILPPGDILVLYTDGITEAMDAGQNEFGRDRLSAAIRDNAQETPDQIANHIIDQLGEFTDNARPHDDRTLVVIKSL
jgi:sigma-B regulation protein RsbU (phosphoserine phosphatase)